MSVLGEFTVPAAEFALEKAFSAVPGMTIEADRLASHSTTEVLPFLWVKSDDFETVHQALAEDPSVTAITVAEEMDDEVLYRLEWGDEFRDLVDEMVDHHAAITEATARDGQWHLQLRFAEEDMVSAFQTHFQDTGCQFEVHQLLQPREPRQHQYGLTAEQYDALVTAVRAGYFQVPRTTSVAQLGESLGISANSISQRLRRGSEILIRNALGIHDETADH